MVRGDNLVPIFTHVNSVNNKNGVTSFARDKKSHLLCFKNSVTSFARDPFPTLQFLGILYVLFD